MIKCEECLSLMQIKSVYTWIELVHIVNIAQFIYLLELQHSSTCIDIHMLTLANYVVAIFFLSYY